MTLDQDYFFWGCSDPVQYGLYSPVVDRFVCVGDQYDLFEQVIFLMSARIQLLIVPLHHAPNFEPNLIDNTCCTQWGVTNWPANSLTLTYKAPITRKHFVVDTCGELFERSNKDLIDIQNFIFLSCHMISLFRINCQYHIFSKLIQLPFNTYEQVAKLERQCYQSIYLSTDYSETKKQVSSLWQTAKKML